MGLRETYRYVSDEAGRYVWHQPGLANWLFERADDLWEDMVAMGYYGNRRGDVLAPRPRIGEDD